MRALIFGLAACFVTELALAGEPTPRVRVPDLPDRLIVEAYQRAAVQNVLASVNPKVFPGYWCVCGRPGIRLRQQLSVAGRTSIGRRLALAR